MDINVSRNEGENVEREEVPTEAVMLKKRSRKRRITIFVVVSLLNVGLLALLWTQLLTPRSAKHSADDSSLVGDIASPLLDSQAPDFTLPVLNGDGTKLHLADFKGKPVVLNFWSSSCIPCRDEAPFLQQTWQKLQARGVVLLGVDTPEPQDGALAFVKKYGLTYPSVTDTLDGATGISYATVGQPETFFIDKNGLVKARWIGPLSQQGLEGELAKVHVSP